MKRQVIFTVLLGLSCSTSTVSGRREVGNLIIEGIPDSSPEIAERILQYQNTRACNLYGWSPDGKGIFISTKFGETNQVHFVEKPGGARRQITFFRESVNEVAVCPQNMTNYFLFTKDTGGNERYQIYLFDLNTGKHKLLSDGKSRNTDILWSRKGNKFAYSSTRRNGKDSDIYIATVDDYANPKLVVKEEGAWYPVSWSSDDKKLIVAKYVSRNDSYFYILDLESGALVQVNPSQSPIGYGQAVWGPQDKSIYFTSNEKYEFLQLKVYDVTSKSWTATHLYNWNVEELVVSKLASHSGEYLAYTTNEDGISRLYVESMDGKKVSLPEIPLGYVYSLSFGPDGSNLGFCINTPQFPGDVYSININNGQLTRWTYSETGGLPSGTFIPPQIIRFKTFDEKMIPAFLYKPRVIKQKYPVLIHVHGGPEMQSLAVFSPLFQFLLNEMGVAVIDPNVRGSSGYGKNCLKLDDGYLREDSVKDVGALIDWIKEQPDLDAEKIAILGGSYGGYMVLASMFHYNDKLRAGIDVVGISNFVTFLENTSEYRRDLRRVEYGDERDPKMREFLNKISPTSNAHKIKRPMFIVHGLNDPRVPASEAEQIVSAVRKNGVDVWYLLAKDEGHGFARKSNRDFMYSAIALFLREHLVK
ncbi:MAG: S9 family peptidase [Planctomycetes bacterium]|nr:S9 family peptidase [Planctomycetota bacterium]